MNTESYVISIPEAASIIGISRYYVQLAINAGKLKTQEFENRTYILRSSLYEYMGLGK